MGTTAQKLNKILETKEAIRTAINNKGGTLTTTDTFASYPSAIDSLPSGGGDSLKEYLDETKNASYMFCGYTYIGGYDRSTTWNSNLTYERLQKILNYNTTSNVTNMQGMFSNCDKLTSIPLINTSLVTNMSNMFRGSITFKTIPQLDTSSVIDMSYMFFSTKLVTTPQLNTASVKYMQYMFNNCIKLTTIDITHMNISSTNNTNNFANNCYSLTKLIIRNMTAIPTLNSNAFTNCYHFTGTTNETYNPQGLKDGRIYVPDDKVEALKTATNWSTYADIIVPLSTLVE